MNLLKRISEILRCEDDITTDLKKT